MLCVFLEGAGTHPCQVRRGQKGEMPECIETLLILVEAGVMSVFVV